MQQITRERVKDETRQDGEGDRLGIVQENEVWPYEPMIYAKPRICPKEWEVKMDPLISIRRPELVVINEKEKLPNCELCYPGWPQRKIEWK